MKCKPKKVIEVAVYDRAPEAGRAALREELADPERT